MLPTIAENFLHDRYGGKRGWVAHLRWKIALLSGTLDRFKYLPSKPIDRVVFVCKGNICRSAYAQSRARMLQMPADSCGTHVGDACRADPFATVQAARRDVDLEQHVPKSVFSMDFRDTDLVAVMEPRQAEWLLRRFPSLQVTLLGAWSPSPRAYLQDPYGRGAEYFQCCFKLIDEAVERLAFEINETRGSNNEKKPRRLASGSVHSRE